MALDRFYRLPEKRRQEILRVAAQVFAEGGYEGTSYNALLERLKMGKSQAYYYFADKADLFVTASTASYEEYYAHVATLPSPGTAAAYWEYVRQLHLIGFEFQKTHPLAAQLTLAAAESPARLSLAQASIVGAASTRARYAEWIALGQGLGAVRKDMPLDLLIHLCVQNAAMVDAWFAERARAATQSEMEEWAVLFSDLLRRMLEPSSP
jgi:AcrR family transcriptional regulator